MFNAGAPEISKQLGRVFVHNSPDSLQLDDQEVLDEQVGEELPEDRFILVMNGKRVLRDYLDSLFLETMNQCGLVHFFEVAIPQKLVDGESRFADDVAQLEDGVPRFHLISLLLCAFCAFLRPFFLT
ncbi:MAG: hypothetical protein JWO38_7695 [Gemmataceae bacterium]|nr:hypothetical protein [Gemmataceae bacterium]